MGTVRLSRDLVGAGHAYDDLKRMVRAGEIARLRRGAYRLDPDDDVDRERELVTATVRQYAADSVLSHRSAALLHGLPASPGPSEAVQLTRDRAGHGRSRPGVVTYGTPLAPSEVVLLDGVRVTSIARTVVDLGRTEPLTRSVPVGDVALARGLAPVELTDALSRSRRRHGVGVARRCVELLDARSESVGESRSRVVLVEHGAPTPVLQRVIVDADGRFVARVDFCWEELGTVGEFDGRVKYGRSLAPGSALEDVLYDEKRREDRLRDLGWQVVRWSWSDLDHPAPLLSRLHRAFDRGRR